MPETKKLPLALIVEPPDAMRLGMDEQRMDELIQSLREVGQINPLSVMPEMQSSPEAVSADTGAVSQAAPVLTGRYEIRNGHRRFLAARALGWKEVECKIYQPGEADARALMAQENLIREDLSDFELGNYYAELHDQPGMTEARLQVLTGKSLRHIYERVALVKGDSEIALAVHKKLIAVSVATVLNKCTDESQRRYWLRLAADGGANTRTVQGWLWDWEKQQGLRPPDANADAQAPAPTAPIQSNTLVCALCGDTTPYNLESVYICRNELSLLRAQLRAAERAAS